MSIAFFQNRPPPPPARRDLGSGGTIGRSGPPTPPASQPPSLPRSRSSGSWSSGGDGKSSSGFLGVVSFEGVVKKKTLSKKE